MKEKDKISYLFEEAVTSFNQEDYPSAIQAWKKILEFDPGNAQATHGIKIATDRMAKDDAGPAAAEPVEPAPAAPAPPAEAGGVDAGEGFDTGDDLGDPFSDAGGGPGDLSFDLGGDDAPVAPPAPAAPAPPAAGDDLGLGEPDPGADSTLDAWGLPSDAPAAEQPLQEGATIAMGADAPTPADSLPPVDDIGDLLEEDPAPAPPAPGGGDEFGWGDEELPSAPDASAGAGELDDLGDLGDLDDFGDLGAVGDLEDLELPPTAPEGDFADRPDADTIPPTDSGDLGFGGGDDIPLAAPPIPDAEDDIEDLEPEDLGLEPDTSSIPLAAPVPVPSIPVSAPAKTGSPIGAIVAVIALLAIVVGGGWFLMGIIKGPKPPGPDGDTTGTTTGTTDGGTPNAFECSEAKLAWQQRRFPEAAELGGKCIKNPEATSAEKAEVQTFLSAAERLSARSIDYQNRFAAAFYRSFCRNSQWRDAFTKLQDLEGRYPQYAEELRPIYTQIYFNYGVDFLQSGEPRAAVDMFQKVLDANPNDAEARQNHRLSVRYSNAPIDKAYNEFVRNLSYRREGCIR